MSDLGAPVDPVWTPQVIANYATYLQTRTRATPEMTITGAHAEVSVSVGAKTLKLTFASGAASECVRPTTTNRFLIPNLTAQRSIHYQGINRSSSRRSPTYDFESFTNKMARPFFMSRIE